MSSFLQRLGDFLSGPVPTPAGPASAAPPSPTPDRPTGMTADDPRLPKQSRPQVERLLALVGEIEGRAARDPLLASALTEVRQMRDVHLPQLVASYADIPPAHRADIFRKTGRSASYVLNEGVEKMIARAEALSRSLAQEDIDSFADNLKFIETRYGGRDPLG
ncbi:hypothetical protein [Sphingomonas sp. Leaf17]|uniref:hypothetical protein n=1 Tax=Sphingomonas sp. Leaf17 TaxID=1735683 RepID=UPI000A9928FA|nr:hypothetical protein [Sphingomonas sp. Leaf17]